jgi:1-acyl-sn-glycerol-3-phosphate acyltransferase
MKYLSVAFKQIWGAWFYFNIAIWFFILFPIFLLTLSFERLYPVAHITRRFWGGILQILALQWWRVEYRVPINFRKQHFILCSNHTSYLDIPMMCLTIPGYFNYMAKAELAKIPLFGRFFRTIDIAVNRRSARDSYRAYELAKAHIAKGASIVIFPEGSIPDSAPVMKKFKAGAFKIALELGVPVLPITFIDNWKLLPDDGKFRARPGIARAVVHEPISVEGLTEADLEAFAEKLYATINGPLVEHGVVPGTGYQVPGTTTTN